MHPYFEKIAKEIKIQRGTTRHNFYCQDRPINTNAKICPECEGYITPIKSVIDKSAPEHTQAYPNINIMLEDIQLQFFWLRQYIALIKIKDNAGGRNM